MVYAPITRLLRGEGSTPDRHPIVTRSRSNVPPCFVICNRCISPYEDALCPGVARDMPGPCLPTTAARQKGQADKPKTPIRRWTYTELLKLPLNFAPSYALGA